MYLLEVNSNDVCTANVGTGLGLTASKGLS